ncbi:Oxygen-dependent choline dehydrogenase [Capillimicrobium parvum]|uniref:long-chain-alcohol oxidase n=2 Tax=Capillimicrobium parvum TaxID=2884022 RepID=A0A9E7BYW0_9ACTN|nr:Oxygen-dependent choline dehydrogenase [Capillimicrobium parvum]
MEITTPAPDSAADLDTAVLTAVCDTLLPSLPSDAPGALGDYLRRGASDRGIPQAVAAAVPGLPPHVCTAVAGLVARLAAAGFAGLPLEERTARLRTAGDEVPQGRLALKQLKGMVFGRLFGSFDEDLRNPVWEAVGFPGPVSPAPSPEQAPKVIPIEPVSGEHAVLTADVCIVGSGAGGSVLAARLAEAGRDVLVLEAGPYRNEADFRQLEAEGAEMYLGGGLMWSHDGAMGLLAGSTLGGGTVINSMISRPAPAEVLADWARDGLDGVDEPEFQACLERVNERLNVNSEATHFNRNAEVLIEGLSACGLDHHRMARNASLDDDPRMCGYCNAGCQQGCKRSTLRTYLEDAAAAGARFVVDCFAERVTTADGRATGVDAVVTNRETGTVTRLRVDAPEVVVAAGGIESPALLLRSGIGGDAVGANLRLHPSYMVSGVYDEPVEAWNGQVITVMSFDFMDLEGGGGFFIAPLGLSPATWGGQSPWTDGAASREHFRKFPHIAAWHAISHDHGAGRVVLGPDDRALVQWGLEDEVDRRVAGLGHVELAKLHRAAGAKEVFTFHFTERRWREGEDFEAFLDELRDAPAEDVTAYSAHQMGACRMGADRRVAVADGRGELHDVAGVWIGDGSALPTAPGVNPMITIMALAERTAIRMLEAAS